MSACKSAWKCTRCISAPARQLSTNSAINNALRSEQHSQGRAQAPTFGDGEPLSKAVRAARAHDIKVAKSAQRELKDRFLSRYETRPKREPTPSKRSLQQKRLAARLGNADESDSPTRTVTTGSERQAGDLGFLGTASGAGEWRVRSSPYTTGEGVRIRTVGIDRPFQGNPGFIWKGKNSKRGLPIEGQDGVQPIDPNARDIDSTVRMRLKREEESRFQEQPIPYTTAASKFIYGVRNVGQALSASKRKTYALYLEQTPGEPFKQNADGLNAIHKLAEVRGIPTSFLPAAKMNALVAKIIRASGDANEVMVNHKVHQGCLLETSPLPHIPLKALGRFDEKTSNYEIEIAPQSKEDAAVFTPPTTLKLAPKGMPFPILIWLHGVRDIGNVGALLRTAAYFGIDVIRTKRAAAPAESNAISRASVGAAEHIQSIVVDGEPAYFIARSQANGWQFWAAVPPLIHKRKFGKNMFVKEPITLEQVKTPPPHMAPTVIVIGNEENGLDYNTMHVADKTVTIGPASLVAQRAGIDSLNVSVAGALLISALARLPSDAKQAASSRAMSMAHELNAISQAEEAAALEESGGRAADDDPFDNDEDDVDEDEDEGDEELEEELEEDASEELEDSELEEDLLRDEAKVDAEEESARGLK